MPIEEKGSAEELARLRTERDEADRRYNEALTTLDAAIQKPREIPPSAASLTMNFRSRRSTRGGSCCRSNQMRGAAGFGRLRVHAWAMVAPLFERQQAFNSALVDHVNRNIAVPP